MSVIVRGPDERVKVLAKGADTTMMPLLREDTPKVRDFLLHLILSHPSCAVGGLARLNAGTSSR